MAIYRTICYKVEDLFIKVIARKQDASIVKEKVSTYRFEKENKKELHNKTKNLLTKK